MPTQPRLRPRSGKEVTSRCHTTGRKREGVSTNGVLVGPEKQTQDKGRGRRDNKGPMAPPSACSTAPGGSRARSSFRGNPSPGTAPPLASSWISSSQVANHNHVTNASCSDDELTEKTQHSNKAHPLAEAATWGVRRKL